MRPAEQWSHPALELADERTILTVDVADPVRPRVVKQVQVSAGLEGASLELKVGNAALLTKSDKTPSRAERSVSIVSLPIRSAPRRSADLIT